MDLLEAFEKLNKLNEAVAVQKEVGKPIDLSAVRKITTDVVDTFGNLETNFCIDYTPSSSDAPILTRVQTRAVVLNKINDEVFFLGKREQGAIRLPGGGYDGDKDQGNPANTITREMWEESNLRVSEPIEISTPMWNYRDSSFVKEHVADPNDRWYGYYTFYYACTVLGTGNNDTPEEPGDWKWFPIARLGKLGSDKTVQNLVNELREY